MKNNAGEIVLEKVNLGNGKYFPGGPTCVFRGKTIKYLPFASSSGGITGDLLVEILRISLRFTKRKKDEDRFGCLLLMDMIHEYYLLNLLIMLQIRPNHMWKVNFVIPHASTSYWQVGDSPEQNEHFKLLSGKVKSE